MADQSELLASFMEMTKASESEAKFFLEMSQWDLDVAITQYFDNNNNNSETQQQQQQQQTPSSSSVAAAVEPQIAPATSQRKNKAPASKIRTLSDFGSRDEGSDDDEHENFFAGGEKSGMIVQGPNKRGGAAGGESSLVDEILKKAAEGRSTSPSPEEISKKEKKPTYYTGSGYRLGSEDEPSTLAEPSNPASVEDEDEEPEPVTRHLTFWRNGFSVDDGPLYEYKDPANQAMLTAINSGRAPLSLLNVRHGQPVEVRVVKRQDEDYTPPPKAPPKPFEGSGYRLGSPSAFSAPSPPAPGAFPESSASSSNVSAPTVDQSQPITSIQVRLGDGSKLVAKLNHTHTISDLRQYIEATHPSQRNYILQTTFPVKELADNNQTIKEAGLLNSVVVQRYQ